MTDSNVDGKHDNVSSSTKKDELRLEDTAELSENSNGVTSCKTPSSSKRRFSARILAANSSSSDKQNLENNDEGGLSKRPKPGESSTSDKAQENGEDTNVRDGTTSSSVAISTASNIKIEPVEENDAPSILSTNDSNVLTNGTISTVVKNERNGTDDTAASTSTGTQDIKDIEPAIKAEKADASSTSIMEKKLKLTNKTQFEHLVRELEGNPTLAKGLSRGTNPANFKTKWAEIAEQLNALGPPTRDSDGWQKVWKDLKFKVKKKMARNKAECNATGGGIYKQLPLSSLEEAVGNLMCFQKQLNPGGMVCGVEKPQVVEEQMCEEVSNLMDELNEFVAAVDPEFASDISAERPSTSINVRAKASEILQSTNKNNRHSLLETHNRMQEKAFSEMSRNLSSIKNTLKDIRKIEEQKLNLLKRKDEREEELFEHEKKIKQIELEIKKKELILKLRFKRK